MRDVEWELWGYEGCTSWPCGNFQLVDSQVWAYTTWPGETFNEWAPRLPKYTDKHPNPPSDGSVTRWRLYWGVGWEVVEQHSYFPGPDEWEHTCTC